MSDEEVFSLYKKERVQQAKEVIYDINRILDFSVVQKKDLRVLITYKKGQIQAKGIMGRALFERGVAGDTTAAIFYMRTQRE